MARVGKERRQQQRGDDRQVEENGRAGGGGEAVIGVEDAGEQGLDRHQRQIREGDAGERHGEIEAGRIEAGGQHADHFRGEDHGDGQHHQVEGDERRGDLIGE